MKSITQFLVNNHVKRDKTPKFDAIKCAKVFTKNQLLIDVYIHNSYVASIKLYFEELLHNSITLQDIPKFVIYAYENKGAFKLDKRIYKGDASDITYIRIAAPRHDDQVGGLIFAKYVYATDSFKAENPLSNFSCTYLSDFLAQSKIPDELV